MFNKPLIGINSNSNSDWVVLENVAATTVLLLGLTVASRIPRLTRSLVARLVALLIYIACVVIYFLVIPESNLPDNKLLTLLRPYIQIPYITGLTRAIIVTVVLIAVYRVSRNYPAAGIKPLLFLGTAAIVGLVGYHILKSDISDEVALWPVLLAAAGFFYLWWLAALAFDLVFVWHNYIRQSAALKQMDEIIGSNARPTDAIWLETALSR